MVYEDLSEQDFQKKYFESIPHVTDRVFAVFFDFILFSPIFSLLLNQIFARLQKSLFSNSNSTEYIVLLFVAIVSIILLTIFGQTVCLYFYGATPGKYFFKMRVISVRDNHGNKNLNFSQCFIRSFIWTIEFLLLGFPFLEVMSHARRRAIHDRASETMVITLKKVADTKPTSQELQFVQLFSYLIISIITLWGLIGLSHLYHRASVGEFKQAELKSESYLCAEVTKLYEDTHGHKNANSTLRMDFALALYLAHEVEDHCLLNEAEYSLWSLDPQMNSWGYFAKGIYFSKFDKNKSKKYFEKTCEINSTFESCRIAKTYQSNAAMLDSDITSMTAMVLKAQALINEGKTNEAHSIWVRLNQRSKGFSSYVSIQIIKQLWAEDKLERVRGAYDLALSSLKEDDRIQLSSWLCLNQVNQGCSKKEVSFCEDLKSEMNHTRQFRFNQETVIGLIKNRSCKRSQEPLLMQFAQAFAEDSDLQQLAMAISSESGWSFEHRMAALRDLTKNKDNHFISLQADLALGEMAPVKSLRLPASQKIEKKSK